MATRSAKVIALLLPACLLAGCIGPDRQAIEKPVEPAAHAISAGHEPGKAPSDRDMAKNKHRSTNKALSVSQRRLIEQLQMAFVEIAGGEFVMGGDRHDDEQPRHLVRVPAFAIGAYEVTFAQYQVFAERTGRTLPDDAGWGRGRRPVINVSWDDAVDFARWLSAETGNHYRLPSEAEWEFVASASEVDLSAQTEICQFENIADRLTWMAWRVKDCEDGYPVSAPVGHFKPNDLGVYDMLGNVSEWVADCWFHHYVGAPEAAVARLQPGCSLHVQRGGAWFYGVDEARAAFRQFSHRQARSVTVGFRLVRDLSFAKDQQEVSR